MFVGGTGVAVKSYGSVGSGGMTSAVAVLVAPWAMPVGASGVQLGVRLGAVVALGDGVKLGVAVPVAEGVGVAVPVAVALGIWVGVGVSVAASETSGTASTLGGAIWSSAARNVSALAASSDAAYSNARTARVYNNSRSATLPRASIAAS